MKRFFEKTKRNAIVGKVLINEKLSKKKVDESPEYEEKILNFKEVKRNLKAFIWPIKNFNTYLLRYSAAFDEYGNLFEKSVAAEDGCKNCSQSAKEIGGRIRQYCENISKECLPTYVLQPLSEHMEKINEIKLLIRKRRKNQILLENENNNLKVANEKKKPVEEIENEINKRTERFQKYDTLVREGITELYSKRFEIYQEICSAIGFYTSELVGLIQNEINTNIPQYSYDNCKSMFSSCTIPPPNEENDKKNYDKQLDEPITVEENNENQ